MGSFRAKAPGRVPLFPQFPQPRPQGLAASAPLPGSSGPQPVPGCCWELGWRRPPTPGLGALTGAVRSGAAWAPPVPPALPPFAPPAGGSSGPGCGSLGLGRVSHPRHCHVLPWQRGRRLAEGGWRELAHGAEATWVSAPRA